MMPILTALRTKDVSRLDRASKYYVHWRLSGKLPYSDDIYKIPVNILRMIWAIAAALPGDKRPTKPSSGGAFEVDPTFKAEASDEQDSTDSDDA